MQSVRVHPRLAPTTIPTARTRLEGLEAGTKVGLDLHSNSQTAADQLSHAKSRCCAATTTLQRIIVNATSTREPLTFASRLQLQRSGPECREAVDIADTKAAEEAAERTAGSQNPPVSGIRASKSSDTQILAPGVRRATAPSHPAL